MKAKAREFGRTYFPQTILLHLLRKERGRSRKEGSEDLLSRMVSIRGRLKPHCVTVEPQGLPQPPYPRSACFPPPLEEGSSSLAPKPTLPLLPRKNSHRACAAPWASWALLSLPTLCSGPAISAHARLHRAFCRPHSAAATHRRTRSWS